MSPELAGIILVGGLLLLLGLGVEIAIAMGVIASMSLLFFQGKSLIQIAWTAWESLNSFTLLAMPLFIFMGSVFSGSGAVRALFGALDKWVGFLPGGLASVVIAANAVFGAISGSSVAAAATFSLIAFPEMERRGYAPRLSIGSIAVGGTLSVLVPPSLILIVYGSWENQSVARLFAAAMVPGIILSLLLLLTVMFWVKLSPDMAPQPPRASWKERFLAIKQLVPWIGVVAAVLGSIFGGLMTPTEAAALGAVLSLIIAWGYGNLNYKMVKESFLTGVRVTAMIGFIIFAARLLSFSFQDMGITQKISSYILSLPLGKYGIMTFLVILYLILGMFFDSLAMMLLTLPFVMPVLINLGYDPIWWGVTFVVLAEIGLITPPFGLNLFTIHGVLPKYSVVFIARSSLPLLGTMILMVWILIFFPKLSLWLPKILY
ncbi:MAG: TRAP transporter large permease [Deltaproteobacteria bacterium]|nr:TRAP transporter large permease [Deltaproteobacteria bacterium]